jgi:Sigma-70, region 4
MHCSAPFFARIVFGGEPVFHLADGCCEKPGPDAGPPRSRTKCKCSALPPTMTMEHSSARCLTPATHPNIFFFNEELKQILNHGIRRLRPAHRIVLELRYVKELSTLQVAKSLGINLSTAKAVCAERDLSWFTTLVAV